MASPPSAHAEEAQRLRVCVDTAESRLGAAESRLEAAEKALAAERLISARWKAEADRLREVLLQAQQRLLKKGA